MLKRTVFVVLSMALLFQSFAALTLQQRVNLEKGLADLTTAVTFSEKAGQAIKRAAQLILDGTITPSNNAFVGHPVTQTQLTEWALRSLRGNMHSLMLPMIMDDSQLPADPNAATDVQINGAVLRSLWPYVQLIGSGNF